MDANATTITALLREMRDEPVFGCDKDVVVAGIRELETGMRLMMARQLRLIAEAERQGLYSEHGARNPKSWLQAMLNISGGDAAARVQVARKVDEHASLAGEPLPADLPETADALSDGAIGLDHAKAVVGAVAGLPPWTSHEQRQEADALLAERARVLEPKQVRVLGERIRECLDPDGALKEEQHQIDSRELHIGVLPDGQTVLKGRLDREAGAKLKAVLEPLAKPRPASDGTPDPRSAAKRSADALVEILDRISGADWVPTSGGEPPHLAVTINWEELRAAVGSGTLTNTGQPLTAATARRIACDCKVLPAVLGGESQPMDVGRQSYTVPRYLRKAVELRDGPCAFPGCDQPPGTSECHHIVHWADGGATSLSNLVMLCGGHHRMVHAQGWNVSVNDQGRPVFVPPAWVDIERKPRPGNTAIPDNLRTPT